MKKIQFLLLLTILMLFYSCETTTFSHTNPLSYRGESSFFQITPYIPYNKIINRIDYGIISNYNSESDSIYLRGTFYDNNTFRDVGNLYFNNEKIEEVKAEDLFNINQLVEGFINFGVAYYQTYNSAIYNQNIEIETSGNELPAFKTYVYSLKSKLEIINLDEITNINKLEGFKINTNDVGYDNSRIKIYNESNSFTFYADFNHELTINPELTKNIPNGDYNIECLKGHYLLDTLANGELMIINIYSSYTFKSKFN